MKLNLGWLVPFALLSVVGCTQMDQRSDMPEKKPLVAMESPLQIDLKWRVDTGNGTNDKDIKLSLAQDHNTLYAVDACGKVMAIKEQTGEEAWTANLKAPVTAGPAVAENRLVVGTSNGKVITVDASNGKVLWTSITTSEILATPTIASDAVYVHTMDGGLSAMSLIDGRKLWRYTHNLPPLMLRRSSSPEVKNDLVIAGFANGKLLAIQKNDGSVTWSQDISNPKGTTDLQRMVDISADPVIQGDHVYAASYQGNVAALSLQTGNVLWERAIPSYAGLTLDQNLLFVSSSNGDIVALDKQNGATYWLQTDLQGRRLSKAAVMNNYLIVGDDDGIIHWLDKSTGKIVGRYELDSEGIEATPIVHNKTVYILGCGGQLIALEVC
ncbi:MAG TPA: outer membrane protein assembly factor BamB [Gammaproteobacteria bacterium]|nr:outer membrane protein assembly factor BamB [Gammaproteobacteria bacterium]